MKNWLKITTVILFSGFVFNLSSTTIYAEEVKELKTEKAVVITDCTTVNPIDLVNNPTNYLDKNIKIFAKFDKFSTLGLDYDKAKRSSKDYISFLIKRPDVAEEYTIPLSELKLILKRDEAEKLLDLESGDKVEITGKVFSTALNDPWIDVYTLNNLEPKEAKKEEDSEEKSED